MRILIIEDEKDLAMILKETFEIEGYYADTVFDGICGLDNALSGIYDLIILDVMLPEMDGIHVLAEVRRNKIEVPVLMLTAKAGIDDRVQGLDNGADDYLTKPFATKELLARIRALTRRKEKLIVENGLSFADISLDKNTDELSCNKEKIRLSKKEYDILELLIQKAGTPISKESLVVKIWGYDTNVEYNSIEVYISFLRKKLKAIGSVSNIKTVWGKGYLIEEVLNGKRN